jgi:hypothetical protein
VHDVVMNVMHHMMMHRVVAAATFGFHGDRFGAISGGFRISGGLLGTRGRSLRGGCRLLRGIGGSLSGLRRGPGLRGGRLRFLRRVLPGASSEQRESQCRPGERDHLRSL